ncbi:hypothetical protein [Legionella tunisiensis]|uniref:hypothetical protein n=1 Tax=Legionella tunisiensis TaxID=1034944 RepID=UPI00037796A8|nr:hypothetical protein [Legionella tunisiensis]
MEQLTFFNKALHQLDEHLFELPHFCRLLMHSLFKHCDFKTGRITNITMEQMQRDLYVAPAPGRKRQKITSDTIRCAFRTIEKFKPDEFIFRLRSSVLSLSFLLFVSSLLILTPRIKKPRSKQGRGILTKRSQALARRAK